MKNLIAEAVAPLKDVAVQQATIYAVEAIEAVRAALAAANWDVNAVAPYPSSRLSRADYRQGHAKYDFFRSLVDFRKDGEYRRFGDPLFCDMSPSKAEAFIESCKRNAAAQYEAYVAKLISKVGEVTEAQLRGTAVWFQSELDVVTAAGERQTWRTKMILNVSCLGKMFNQWPTRQVKN
jgi:hypothetical protein